MFFADDAFGVETIRRLSTRNLPLGVFVKEFGIRGFDLACSLTEQWDLVILVDSVKKGGKPGSVYVIELDASEGPQTCPSRVEPHGLHPAQAIELANTIGKVTARLILVGCEPETLGGDEGSCELSASVEKAIDIAIDRIEHVISEVRQKQASEIGTTDSNVHESFGGSCHMCLAIPGKIVQLSDTDPTLATVEVAGVRRRIDLGLIEQDKPALNDWVLIHVGFAMSKVSEQDALEQMKTLAMLGETEAAVNEIRGYGLNEDANATSRK
jgi:hydrogenase assembly chaperone HypC/HupF